MNGGFERARAVFGGEAELERVLADMNAAVFGRRIRPAAPRRCRTAPDKPLN